MTATNPMTRRELLELAALDALGMLDEYEAALYTRSYHQAPAGVQDEIAELQARISTDLAAYCDEEPDPALRSRVIEYVSRAVESEGAELAPIATIGRPRATAASRHEADIAGRIGGNPAVFWRVAVFALCTATLVLAYVLSESMRQSNEFARMALENNTGAQLEDRIGPTAKDYIFDASSHRIVLIASVESHARAVVLADEAFTNGLLVTDELPAGVYELRVTDAGGATHVVDRFEARDRLSGRRIEIVSLNLSPGARWELSGPGGLVLANA
jgi:hypothetical protein